MKPTTAKLPFIDSTVILSATTDLQIFSLMNQLDKKDNLMRNLANHPNPAKVLTEEKERDSKLIKEFNKEIENHLKIAARYARAIERLQGFKTS